MPSRSTVKSSPFQKHTAPKSSNCAVPKLDDKGPLAVVVADLVASRFQPLSSHTPHCLLPLANVPLLHYALSRLVEDGFKDILIYSCNQSTQVEEFIRDSSCYENTRIRVHHGDGSSSIGDVMRDLDSRQALRGVADFLLVPADLVCARPLLPFLVQHQQRRTRNPSAILSLILPYTSNVISRSQASEWGVMAIFSRSADNRLIRLQHVASPSVAFSDILRPDHCVELASDLMDLEIAACSAHIPPLFQDNFDYRTLGDLIHDVLTNEEVMDYSIHVDPVPNGPLVLRAAPDLQTLINLGPHILSRFASVPDVLPPMLLPQNCEYSAFGPQVYVAKSASVHPKAKIVGACLIGPGCRVDSRACLIDCILASDCRVGEKTCLRRVVACCGATFGARVSADTAWVCAKATVLDGVRMPFCCFIGPSVDSLVSLGPGRGALPFKSVLVAPNDIDLILEPAIGGAQVWAAEYIRRKHPASTHHDETTSCSLSTESDNEGDQNVESAELSRILWHTAEDRLRSTFKRYLRERNRSRVLSGASDSYQLNRSITRKNRCTSDVTDSDADLSGISNDEGEQSEVFLIAELRRTMERVQDKTDLTENLILEVNSLKHAYNIPIEDLHFLLIKALLELTRSNTPPVSDELGERAQLRLFMVEFTKQLERFHGVLKSYLCGSHAHGRLCLQALEDSACYQPLIMSASPFIAHALYDKDLVTEQAVWWWLSESPLLVDEELAEQTKLVREKMKPFLAWLKEAEEDDSEESCDPE
ncbi:unnamed protein product [Dicrocoelium dendriticum]|nr:unnamed protein product [Dicrocoelium dendriticum]